MTYYFRADLHATPDLVSFEPHACTIRTPTQHVVSVCSGRDANTLRRALQAVFDAGKECARREMRDALGLPPP